MVETLQQLQLKKIIMKFPLSRGKKDTGLLKSSQTGYSESILWLFDNFDGTPPHCPLLVEDFKAMLRGPSDAWIWWDNPAAPWAQLCRFAERRTWIGCFFSWNQGLFLFSDLNVCRNCLRDHLKSKSGIHLPRSHETWASIPSTMKKMSKCANKE